jgi:hypothetical protein
MKRKSEVLAAAEAVAAAASEVVVAVAAAEVVAAAAAVAEVVGAAAVVVAVAAVEAAAVAVAADRADEIAADNQLHQTATKQAKSDGRSFRASAVSFLEKNKCATIWLHFSCAPKWRRLDMQPGGCAS